MTDQHLIRCACDVTSTSLPRRFVCNFCVSRFPPCLCPSRSDGFGFGPDYFGLTTQRPQTQSDNVRGPLCHRGLSCGRHRMQLSLSRRRTVMKNAAVSSLCRRNNASWEKGTLGAAVRKITVAPPSLIIISLPLQSLSHQIIVRKITFLEFRYSYSKNVPTFCVKPPHIWISKVS